MKKRPGVAYSVFTPHLVAQGSILDIGISFCGKLKLSRCTKNRDWGQIRIKETNVITSY